jgi:hypothetical protein
MRLKVQQQSLTCFSPVLPVCGTPLDGKALPTWSSYFLFATENKQASQNPVQQLLSLDGGAETG